MALSVCCRALKLQTPEWQNLHSRELDRVDQMTAWLTRLLVFSLPIMLLNPMDPAFHRLQLSELLALPMFVLMALHYLRGRFPIPKLDAVGVLLALLACILYGSAFTSIHAQKSILEATKVFYLIMLAVSIYLSSRVYGLGQELLSWASASYLLVLLMGVIGIGLLAFGVHSSLAEPSRIIGVALGIEDLVPITPRVTSLLKPTANMTAAYLAVSTLPILDHLFKNYIPPNKRVTRLALIATVVVISLLTMSRAFVGTLLAVWLGLLYLRWDVLGRRFWVWAGGIATVAAFCILELYTILYPLAYSATYTNDPAFVKEIVDLGTKQVPNPVYFLRPAVGSESFNFEFMFAFNHYAWLKYAGWVMFTQEPWLGVGPGGFSDYAALLGSKAFIPADLADYRSAQSHYFTLLAEMGLLGFTVICGLIWMLKRKMTLGAGRSLDGLDRIFTLNIVVLAVICIDMDVLSFRWLWGLGAIILAAHLQPKARLS